VLKHTHRDGPSSSNAMHHRPSCLKYSTMWTMEAGRSGREQIVFSMSISILKSAERVCVHERVFGRVGVNVLRKRLGGDGVRASGTDPFAFCSLPWW
jgi:hypothetical protein